MNIGQYYRSDGGYLMMDSGKSVPVSRSKRNQLHQMLEEL
jgi:hypothetical protein